MSENPQARALLRWEEHGAPWRVLQRTSTQATVSLLTCDDGTEVERLTSSHPDFLTLVDQAPQDPPGSNPHPRE